MRDAELLDILGCGQGAGDKLNELADQFRRGREISELTVLLGSESADVVSMAAWVLGELRLEIYDNPPTLTKLRELTAHDDATVRFHALGALFPALRAEDSSTQRLIDRLMADSNEGVRGSAEAAALTLGLK